MLFYATKLRPSLFTRVDICDIYETLSWPKCCNQDNIIPQIMHEWLN